MKFSMTGQEKGDIIIQVTTWAGLTVQPLHITANISLKDTRLQSNIFYIIKATFSLYQLWPLDIGLAIPLIWMWELFSLYQEYQYCFLCVMDVNSFWSKWNIMVIIVSCVCGFFLYLGHVPDFLMNHFDNLYLGVYFRIY
jgi:hypothetical protein